jgi:hypothetical protein
VSAAARVRLLLAEERRAGRDFDSAWGRAVAAVGERPELDFAREEFRAAFERRSSPLVALTPLEREREAGALVLG